MDDVEMAALGLTKHLGFLRHTSDTPPPSPTPPRATQRPPALTPPSLGFRASRQCPKLLSHRQSGMFPVNIPMVDELAVTTAVPLEDNDEMEEAALLDDLEEPVDMRQLFLYVPFTLIGPSVVMSVMYKSGHNVATVLKELVSDSPRSGLCTMKDLVWQHSLVDFSVQLPLFCFNWGLVSIAYVDIPSSLFFSGACGAPQACGACSLSWRSEITLAAEPKHERERLRKVMDDVEMAALGLTKHLGFLRHTSDTPPPSPTPPRATQRPPALTPPSLGFRASRQCPKLLSHRQSGMFPVNIPMVDELAVTTAVPLEDNDEMEEAALLDDLEEPVDMR
ncbi:hypothetical protein BDZ89DRAFT_1036506 [Hymenopellis radicata]|nr:hypothetical protein BDZ89DRAFT_1036506 [Hymenopellis radicata]